MAAVFLKLLDLSISASWLAAVVCVLRLAFRRAPKWARVLLWGLVALRLALPFSVESALSLVPRVGSVRAGGEAAASPPAVPGGAGVVIGGAAALSPSPGGSLACVPAAGAGAGLSWPEIAGAVWLAGLGVMLLGALVSFLRLRRRVSPSLSLGENIYLCDAIPTPFILGAVRPRIYLPSALDEVQRQNVLAHERAHLARGDHWWKPLGFALLAVYWFDPLLWLAYALFCRDIELACDERVIRDMDADAVRTYSRVLLACSAPGRPAAACPLAFGEVGVKERVKNALRYRRPALWVTAVSVLVCAAAAVCFLTDPRRETMQWAKHLQAEDVARVELTVLPQAADRQYRDLDREEIAAAVALINRSGGRYVSAPGSITGSTVTLYVTTTDGVRHTVANAGGVYLCIDGDTYRGGPLAWPYTEGDSPLPEGFRPGGGQSGGSGGQTDAQGPTGYPAYDALLADICALRRAGVQDAGGEFSAELLAPNDYYQTPGWLLRDLDGDGTPELLLGADWDGGPAVLFGLYRLDGGETVRVAEGWDRDRWYLCTDGGLAEEGSSSAFESRFSYYRYTGGALRHVETLLLLDDGSGGASWYYSAAAADDPGGDDVSPVSDSEAAAVMAGHPYEALTLTPFDSEKE